MYVPSGCGGSRTRLGPLNGHTLVGGRTPFASSRLAGFGVHVPRPSLPILLRVAWAGSLVVRRGLTRPLATIRTFRNCSCEPPVGVWAAAPTLGGASLIGVDNRQGFHLPSAADMRLPAGLSSGRVVGGDFSCFALVPSKTRSHVSDMQQTPLESNSTYINKIKKCQYHFIIIAYATSVNKSSSNCSIPL